MAAHQAPHPWDSPGKNTGVGCHFLLQCMKVKSESKVAQLCPTLSDPMDCSLQSSSILVGMEGFARQEYWSGLPLSSTRPLSDSPNSFFFFLIIWHTTLSQYKVVLGMLCFVTQSCLILCKPMDCSPPGFSVHGDSPGKNTGMDCHAFTSRRSSQPRDQTHVSCIEGRFFTIWATKEDSYQLFKVTAC